MSSREGDAGRARPRRGGRGRAWDRARARPLVLNRGARGTLDGRGLCGSGARRVAAGTGTSGHKAPRAAPVPGRESVERGVDGVAGAGSLCLFISNLIRTASGELLLPDRRAFSHYANGCTPAAAPHWNALRFPELRLCVWSAVLFLEYPFPGWETGRVRDRVGLLEVRAPWLGGLSALPPDLCWRQPPGRKRDGKRLKTY